MLATSRSVLRKKNSPNARMAADENVETASAPKSQGSAFGVGWPKSAESEGNIAFKGLVVLINPTQ
jgi:hypothetical protein